MGQLPNAFYIQFLKLPKLRSDAASITFSRDIAEKHRAYEFTCRFNVSSKERCAWLGVQVADLDSRTTLVSGYTPSRETSDCAMFRCGRGHTQGAAGGRWLGKSDGQIKC